MPYRDHTWHREDSYVDRTGYVMQAWRCGDCRAQYLSMFIAPGAAIFYAIDSNAVYAAPCATATIAIVGACTCGGDIHLTWRHAAITSDLNAIGLDAPPANVNLN